jgi:hypothetical protein
MKLPIVGLVGGSGGVGRVVARRLCSTVQLRVGGRRAALVKAVVDDALEGRGQGVELDVMNGASLELFCAGCDLIVNCAAPYALIGARVARAAFAAGADYVDPAGDERLRLELSQAPKKLATARAMLCAGMLPGLSGLLPRFLALDMDRSQQLLAYIGVLDHFTPGSAADFLAGLEGSESLAAWRQGRRASRALKRLTSLALPFFSTLVTAHPYLNHEGERIARLLQLEGADWYNVFEGNHVLSAMSRLGTRRDASTHAGGEELVKAAELDLAGRAPYQIFLFQLDGIRSGRRTTRSMFARSVDSNELTGAVAALAAEAVLGRQVAPGAHFAAEVLDPSATLRSLRDSGAIAAFEVLDRPLTTVAQLEDGAL